MKKLIYTAVLLLLMTNASAQQFPFLEGYGCNLFGLSPSYAGLYNSKTIFMDYRSDWTGIEGGPSTIRLSYNDKINEKVGIGARFITDRTDIFKQSLLLGTYTYEVKVSTDHLVNFGLSAGFFRNSIDLAKYYNDPDYVSDNVLLYGLQKSRIKFATDVSALYRYKQVEAGLLFSNIMLGTARYRNTDLTYKPFRNYLVHASYYYKINEKWSLKPIAVYRGGRNVPGQFEISPNVKWNDKFWGNVVYRTGGILGISAGGEVYKGVVLDYSYNFSTGISMNIFGGHQITLGVRIPEL